MKNSGILWMAIVGLCLAADRAGAVEVRGQVFDEQTGKLVAARLYVQDAAGQWFFAKADHADGAAYENRVQYRRPDRTVAAEEMYTIVSAHPFVLDLPPGRYTITAERGKEYRTGEIALNVPEGSGSVMFRLPVRRWIHMADRGWYSGDTHNHRKLAEVPVTMLAEDLNVAMPITYWVTDSLHRPDQNNKVPGDAPTAKLIEVAPNHVIWPLNTEYEIFSMKGKTHTLGAIMLVNHQRVFTRTVPPVAALAREAKEQGALIDLDKQNWPWSMMLVPVAKVDLFELSNNHIWRTNFWFADWYAEYVPQWMRIDRDAEGRMTERGWTEYGFQSYYMLLNCGFRLRPTAGTASGVHPVPLGFGRVYVYLPEGFSYSRWMEGLDAGRSFVSTGPMIDARFNDQLPGHTFTVTGPQKLQIHATIRSEYPISRVEVVINGDVVHIESPIARKTATGEYETELRTDHAILDSAWAAVRCWEIRADGRERFAHTAPVYVDIAGRKQKPKEREVRFLVDRVRGEIERNQGVLDDAMMAEFEQALQVYESLLD